jgi:hypothetical protein
MNLMQSTLSDHSPLRALVPLCLALLLMAVASPASQVFRYREQTGDESITFSWRADREEHSTTVTVTQHQGDEVFSSVNTPDGTTLSWQYVKQPGTDIRAERVGDSLRFSGRLKGQPIEKSQAIDPRPWWQPLSFSLQRLVAGERQTASFWTIRPDTLEVLALQAEKTGSEQIPAENGGLEPADKVIIRPDGLLSALWQAEYWFRPGDHLFLRYRGTHGPPGTAETRICLISP